MSVDPAGWLPDPCRCALLGDNLAELAEKNGCAGPAMCLCSCMRVCMLAATIMACCRGLLVVRCTHLPRSSILGRTLQLERHHCEWLREGHGAAGGHAGGRVGATATDAILQSCSGVPCWGALLACVGVQVRISHDPAMVTNRECPVSAACTSRWASRRWRPAR